MKHKVTYAFTDEDIRKLDEIQEYLGGNSVQKIDVIRRCIHFTHMLTVNQKTNEKIGFRNMRGEFREVIL